MMPHYYGKASKAFWARVHKLRSGQDVVYTLGVALQNLEGFVLQQLENYEAESYQIRKVEGRKPKESKT